MDVNQAMRRVGHPGLGGFTALEGLPPTGVFNDVVEAANGDLFFTADRDAGLYRLPRR